MLRRIVILASSPRGLSVAATPASGGWPGRYGPFYRTGDTQDNATITKQINSGEVWGKPQRGSNFPSVDAHLGHLPDHKHGIEFYTDVKPSPGAPPPQSALARSSQRRAD